MGGAHDVRAASRATVTGPHSKAQKIATEGRATITASITVEAAQELGLKVGDEASAIIKASDVIVSKE
jgi:molybdopterin-binding protein